MTGCVSGSEPCWYASSERAFRTASSANSRLPCRRCRFESETHHFARPFDLPHHGAMRGLSLSKAVEEYRGGELFERVQQDLLRHQFAPRLSHSWQAAARMHRFDRSRELFARKGADAPHEHGRPLFRGCQSRAGRRESVGGGNIWPLLQPFDSRVKFRGQFGALGVDGLQPGRGLFCRSAAQSGKL